MPGTSKLELQIALDDGSDARVTELARRWCEYYCGTALGRPLGQSVAKTEEPILRADNALLEVFVGNPDLARAGVKTDACL